MVLTFLYLACFPSQNVPQRPPWCKWFHCVLEWGLFSFSKPEWYHIMYVCYIICAHESTAGHQCGVCVAAWCEQGCIVHVHLLVTCRSLFNKWLFIPFTSKPGKWDCWIMTVLFLIFWEMSVLLTMLICIPNQCIRASFLCIHINTCYLLFLCNNHPSSMSGVTCGCKFPFSDD